MSTLQKILLAVLVLVMVVLIIVFWGSLFSILMAAAMFMIIPIYLYNRFLNTDEASDFAEDQNG